MSDPHANHGRPGWDAHVHVFDAAHPVRPGGHYAPVTNTLESIETLANAHNVQHLVLVQPSVYGSDHRLIDSALAKMPGRHRAVLVLPENLNAIDADRMASMHAQGARGVRLNLVSPVGSPIERLQAHGPALLAHVHEANRRHPRGNLATALTPRPWHVQWYAHAHQLDHVLHVHRQARDVQGHDVVCVLDHLAGLNVDAPQPESTWRTLQALADMGAWIKLSGWYRLGQVSRHAASKQARASAYAACVPLMERVATLFGRRMVWASDWPHTGQDSACMPDYADCFDPVRQALGEAHALTTRTNGWSLYA